MGEDLIFLSYDPQPLPPSLRELLFCLSKSKPSEAGLIWIRKKEPTDMQLGAKAASGVQSASSDAAVPEGV